MALFFFFGALHKIMIRIFCKYSCSQSKLNCEACVTHTLEQRVMYSHFPTNHLTDQQTITMIMINDIFAQVSECAACALTAVWEWTSDLKETDEKEFLIK